MHFMRTVFKLTLMNILIVLQPYFLNLVFFNVGNCLFEVFPIFIIFSWSFPYLDHEKTDFFPAT